MNANRKRLLPLQTTVPGCPLWFGVPFAMDEGLVAIGTGLGLWANKPHAALSIFLVVDFVNNLDISEVVVAAIFNSVQLVGATFTAQGDVVHAHRDSLCLVDTN